MGEMDGDLRSLLEKWGVRETYIQRLEDQDILSVDMLLELTEDHIKLVFDTIGSLITFKKNFVQFKQEQGAQGEKPALRSLDCNESSGGGQLDNEGNLATTSTSDMETTDDQDSNGSLVATLATPVTQKRKRKSNLHDDLDLEKTLKLCVDGKVVMAYYQEYNDLNDRMRNTLADIILNDHLKDEYDRKLSYDDECAMAESIVKLFPTECMEIWVASTPNARQRSCGRAKLLSRYYQKRRFLHKGKLLSKDKEDKEDNEDDLEEGPLADDLLWLKNTKQPWSKVEELWRSTSKHRLRQLKGGQTSIENYLNSYPALRDQSGYHLLEMDFEIAFPESRMNLFSQWPKLKAFVASKLPKAEGDSLKACVTEDATVIKIFHSLPFLFNVTTCARKGKNKQWRPSRLEVAEALLLHVKCRGDIDPTLTSRLKEKYEPYDLALCPQAIIVGPDVEHISECYVKVNRVLYLVESPKKAIDITFKLLHSLDAKYPCEAEREWLFLERAVYGVNVDGGKDSKIRPMWNDFKKFCLHE